VPHPRPFPALNLILFEQPETELPLPRTDRRAIHLLDVLRRVEGDTFDAGLVNGPRGKATLLKITEAALSLQFSWGDEPPPNDPLTVVIGLPRPQTAKVILREAAALGIAAVHFVRTEKGDSNYRLSSLWEAGEWRRHLISGAEQAFCTRLPDVSFDQPLIDVLSTMPMSATTRIALDNYEAQAPLTQIALSAPSVTLAIGPERGWSAAERDQLRNHRFTLAHLGARVLRTETACIAAITLVKAKCGWL